MSVAGPAAAVASAWRFSFLAEVAAAIALLTISFLALLNLRL